MLDSILNSKKAAFFRALGGLISAFISTVMFLSTEPLAGAVFGLLSVLLFKKCYDATKIANHLENNTL